MFMFYREGPRHSKPSMDASAGISKFDLALDTE